MTLLDQRDPLGLERWLKDEITFSSATIRNEMADLEELGFIEKRTVLLDVFLLRKATDFM